MQGRRLFIGSAIVLGLVASFAWAAATGTEAIKQRQHEMEGVRDAMMALGAIAKGQQPFDAEVVQASAAKIAGHLEQAAELFPAGSESGDVETWAKPEIWSDRENFDVTLKAAHEAAVELQAVSEAEAFPPALGKLGNSCKSCHDLYRLPKS